MVLIIVGIRYLIMITINTFRIRKNEVLYISKNFDLTQKSGSINDLKQLFFFLFYYKNE